MALSPKSFDGAFKYASKFDKDTFVFIVIVVMITVLVAARVELIVAVEMAGFLIISYVIYRYALSKLQAKEREELFKSLPPARAKKLILDSATPDEQKKLKAMSERVKQGRK
ncbi:hypothetical protein [Rhizobium sp. C1]|uniref:hypothetical protein n=1 Tax=Rhizobium sp. C1 TaxID=1349799 RepID=UPI001E5DD385|nr:hypothetical protein [Rhizobium sp. C1]MCD2177476.1 hypothetical protein [Rhizobium sp. C1]